MLLKVLEKIFRLFDVNGDGSISKEEMKRLVKASTEVTDKYISFIVKYPHMLRSDQRDGVIHLNVS